jgi:tRNA isopentenyl-2-thiomethyl-A-37 hydroxylase MiaE
MVSLCFTVSTIHEPDRFIQGWRVSLYLEAASSRRYSSVVGFKEDGGGSSLEKRCMYLPNK